MRILSAELEAAIADLQTSIEAARADIRKLDDAVAILRAGGVERSLAIDAILKERKRFEVGLNDLLKAQRNLQNVTATEKRAGGSTTIH